MTHRGEGAADSGGAATPPFDAVLFASYGTSREEACAASIAPVAACLREGLGCRTVCSVVAGRLVIPGEASAEVANPAGDAGAEVAAPAGEASAEAAAPVAGDAGAEAAAPAAGAPGCEPRPLFLEAYTSAKARRVLDRRGTHVPDVSEALHALARAGARRVLVQPGHLVYGAALAQVEQAVSECRFLFTRLVLARPLLASDEDLEAVARALAERHPRYGGEALVLVAHGTEGIAGAVGSVYATLGMHLRVLGRDDAYVGSMNEFPRAADVVRLVGLDRERAGEGPAVHRVRLVPLMLTAAAHASRDINGEQDGSWRSAFERAGYEVVCELEGQGALPAVRELYLAHARAAWDAVAEAPAGGGSPSGGDSSSGGPGGGSPSDGGPGGGALNDGGASDTGAPHVGPQDAVATSHTRFPLFVDLRGSDCLVVGLGTVGLRRARTLARFGARVTALDPALRPEDEREATALGIQVERRDWVPADVEGKRLVVAATDVRAVNAVVARACGRAGVLVSVADSAEESTCYFPALCESAHLIAGVVSDGAHHELTARAAASVRAALREVDHG